MPATIYKVLRKWLQPGLDFIVEAQKDTVQFGAADTVKDLTFTFAQAFKDAPIVTASARISENVGAALNKVTRVEILSVTTTQAVIRLEGNAAPGGGETADVEAHIHVMGKPAR